MTEGLFLVQQTHNYSKIKTLVQNEIIQKEEPERHFRTPAETFYKMKTLKIVVKLCKS
jgi:hypothetical protein